MPGTTAHLISTLLSSSKRSLRRVHIAGVGSLVSSVMPARDEAMVNFEMCKTHLNALAFVTRFKGNAWFPLIGVPRSRAPHGCHEGFAARGYWDNTALSEHTHNPIAAAKRATKSAEWPRVQSVCDRRRRGHNCDVTSQHSRFCPLNNGGTVIDCASAELEEKDRGFGRGPEGCNKRWPVALRAGRA
jgi:hypothetical protein